MTPVPGGGPFRTAEVYACARDCQNPDGSWNAQAREARGCKVPGLPVVPFNPTAALYQKVQGANGSPYIGRYPDRRLVGAKYLGVLVPSWKEPFDPPELGCPGAWYRTPFIDSLDPYTRRRDSNGGRVPNPLFDSADRVIQALAMRLEEEEERAHAYTMKAQADRARAELEAQAAAQKNAPASRGRGRGRR